MYNSAPPGDPNVSMTDMQNTMRKDMQNERTSKRVAKIAGKLLAGLKGAPAKTRIGISGPESGEVTVGDLRALAASALTQTADKPKKAAAKRKKRL